MSRANAPVKNFGLSVEEFDKLVIQLKLGNTELFKSIFVAHFDDCVTFITRKYRTSHDEAYDATMATMLNFRKYLISDKITYGNLRFLFTRMAGQLLLKNRTSSAFEDLGELDLSDQVENVYDEADYKRLKIAWSMLSDDCRELLTMNYYGTMKLNEIADQLGRSATSIRKQKERCKKKLISLFNDKAN